MNAPESLGPAATIGALNSTTHPLGDLTALPAASGLDAWWAAPAILPHLPGPTHPHQENLRVLYVGIALNLRRRIIGNHLRRSGSSTLRRTIAGLLLAEHGYRTERPE